MEKQIIQIQSIEFITRDVMQIVADKPPGLEFQPGQAADISIHEPIWENEIRPFTFTSLPVDDFLEFTIKSYPSHQGVTNKLRSLKKGDELILHSVFGAIQYKGEGVFIAGGAGVTPFISIFRQLHAQGKIGNNKLLFANKTKADIILEKEFTALLGNHFVNILSEEHQVGYAFGFISASFLQHYLSSSSAFVYLCGPPGMMNAVTEILAHLGVSREAIVHESF